MKKETVSQRLEKVIKFFAKGWLLIFICILVLIVPLILRYNLPMAGDNSYFYIRIADAIKDKGISLYDNLSYSGRELIPEFGWPLVLAGVSKLFSITSELASKILLIILGVLSFILFYYLTRELKVRTLASLFLIVSPGFLYLFSISNVYAMSIFLTLLSLFLYKKDKLSSLIIFFLIPFFSFNFMPLVIIFYYLYRVNRRKDFIKYFVVFMLPNLIYIPSLFKYGFEFNFNKNIIFDFGITFGIGIFLLILSIFGLAELWKRKYEFSMEYFLFISLILISFYFNSVLFYLNFMVSILAAIGFYRLMKRRWESNFIEMMILLIFLCGALFSGLSYISQYKNELPNQDIVDGLLFLKSSGTVFSYSDRGNWISEISKNKNIIDSSIYSKERIEEMNSLLYATNFDESTWLLEKYGVRYMFIDKELKEKLWRNDEEGLLFMLKYDKRFRKVYNKNDVEIWEYIKK